MVKVLDGAALAKQVRDEFAQGVAEMREKHGVTPGLAAVLVGEDPASAIYVRNKGRACEEVGMFSETFLLPGDATQSQVSGLVDRLNQDQRFHGILVQLPLPAQLDEAAAIQELEPLKDVDGIHPYNLGKLLQGTPIFIPGTPAGIQSWGKAEPDIPPSEGVAPSEAGKAAEVGVVGVNLGLVLHGYGGYVRVGH